MTWDCDVCGQLVEREGPWCDLYIYGTGPVDQRLVNYCRPRLKKLLREADARGDGPFVNALCQYGRKRWGEDIDW